MGKLVQLFLILSIIYIKIQKIYSAGNLYTSDQNNVYYLDNEQKYTWFDAFTKCLSMNMSLATIDTMEKSDDLTNLLSKTFGNVNGMWIGAIANGKDHHYIWTSTGNEMTFSNWSPGEPSFDNSQEYCVLTGWTNEIKWNDGGCYSLFGIICDYNENYRKEKELNQLLQNQLQEELSKEQQLQSQLQNELTKAEHLELELQELQNQVDRKELLLQLLLDYRLHNDRRNKSSHDIVVNVN